MPKPIEYFIVGIRPVKSVPTPEGGLGIYAYDWKTGQFVLAMEYLTRIFQGYGEIEQVSEEEFDRAVAALRARPRK